MEILITGIIIFSIVLFLVNTNNKKKHEFQKSTYLPEVNALDSRLIALSKYYISFSELEVLRPDYEQLYKIVEQFPKRLRQESIFSVFLNVYKDLEKWREKSNQLFIDEELERTQSLLNDIDGKALDLQQREAVIVNEDNTLVLAGAGSGKTLTISAKVKYLVEQLGVQPDEILLLSFTKKSALEMTERIKNKLKIPIEANTFHKLGLNIITSNEGYRPEIMDDLTQVINIYFSRNVLKDQELLSKVLHFYGYYLVIPKDIEGFGDLGEYHEDQSTVDLETLRSKIISFQKEDRKEKRTLKMEQVRSIEEVMIANFLFLNGIEYEYERPYPFTSPNKYKKQYRPDFYLPEYDLYLEHFGITEDERVPWLTPIEAKKYIESMKWKREWHKVNGTTLLETYSYFNRSGMLVEKLGDILRENGVTFKQVDMSELYRKLFIEREEERQFKEFKKLIGTFISLFKSSGFDETKFGDFIDQLQVEKDPLLKERSKLFLSIVEPIYMHYEYHLLMNEAIDFNDMINDATNIVMNYEGELFKYKYIIIDEYQDISMSRYRLIKAIKEKTNSKVLCVGDDWQSIYRFAGSDLQLFINFEKYFGHTKLLRIEQTYRNSQELIDLAGKFIMKNNRQLVKDLKSDKRMQLPVKIFGYSNDSIKALTLAIEEIVESFGEDTDIMIIGRNNFDMEFLFIDNIPKIFKLRYGTEKLVTGLAYRKYPNLKISYSTVHRSKGLEAENVILINLNNHLIGFPNKISDDPILSIVLTDADQFSYAEERRLFYVALTRTKNNIYLIAPDKKTSAFVEELIREHQILFNIVTNEESMRENPNCPHCQSGRLVIRENSTDRTRFLGCSNFPRCDSTLKDVSILSNPIKCTSCGGYMVKRKGPYGEFYGCTNYPSCRNSFDIREVKKTKRTTVKAIF
ncbi:DNA helicase [Sporosarcina sp. ANT_H38]|uniref:UvrD-helicase domain-containing protein n=1 Tax=Sporosarcina sp. ANT_H38 TaxID=2597358 RepID=UPI00165DBB04|nr:UvrD-helicase domain-containing protein [Sporosarcina sp. ANT_H38]